MKNKMLTERKEAQKWAQRGYSRKDQKDELVI